jgi:hypothetical protein
MLHKCTPGWTLGMWPGIGDHEHAGGRVRTLPCEKLATVQKAEKPTAGA